MASAPWYRVGTVSVTAGSKNVSGVDTLWLGVIGVGDLFTLDGTRWAEVESVTSNGILVLKTAWGGATAANVGYAIARNFTGSVSADLAAALTLLQQRYHVTLDEIGELYTATGDVQITDPEGVAHTVPGWVKLAAQIDAAPAYRGVVQAANIDSVTLPGIYQQQNAGDSQGLLVFNPLGSLGEVQLSFTYGGEFKWRNRTDGVSWTPWRVLWHSANDGAGSGMDADLLDGQQGSYYAPINAPAFLGRVVAILGSASNGVAAHQFGAVGLNKISMHLGDGDTTAAGAHDFGAALRFGGSGVAWGDLAYFPKAGLQDGGQFRLSTTGDALNTTPNASLGVGSLYSAGSVGIGTGSPASYSGYRTVEAVGISGGGGGIFKTTSSDGVVSCEYFAANGPNAATRVITVSPHPLVLGTNGVDRVTIDTSGGVSVVGPIKPGQYTLATLPAASAYNGYTITVSNATGGPALCLSDGANWLNVRTNAAVN